MTKKQFDEFVKFCTNAGIITPLFGAQNYKSLCFNELKYFLTLNPDELSVIFVKNSKTIILEHKSGISYLHWQLYKKTGATIQIVDKSIAEVFCNVENFLVQKDMTAESYLNRKVAKDNKISEFKRFTNFINNNKILTEINL